MTHGRGLCAPDEDDALEDQTELEDMESAGTSILRMRRVQRTLERKNDDFDDNIASRLHHQLPLDDTVVQPWPSQGTPVRASACSRDSCRLAGCSDT
jgi:hypothetical protein